jgi:small subunit ribosomal protein S4
MGDPKKRRKQYKTPRMMWEKERIDTESALIKEYGLKNKKEIWKMGSILSSLAQQAKKLIAAETPQSVLEKKQLLSKAASLGLISSTAQLEDILALDLRKILDRRLQTIVLKKSFAKTIKQARQFIIHRHIAIGDKTITIPSYLVLKSEQDKISFIPTSNLSNPEHPERVQKQPSKTKIEKKETKKIGKKEEKKPEDKKEKKQKEEKKEKPKEEKIKEKKDEKTK